MSDLRTAVEVFVAGLLFWSAGALVVAIAAVAVMVACLSWAKKKG